MKKTICMLVALAVVSVVWSQKPEKPAKSLKTSSVTVSSSNNLRLSVKESNRVLKVRATYSKRDVVDIVDFLKQKLGAPVSKGNKYVWEKDKNGKKAMEWIVDTGSLRVYLDGELLSKYEYKRYKEISEALSEKLGGSKYNASWDQDQYRFEFEQKQRDLESAKRRLERAQRELERAQRELEEIKRKNKN
ncbi:MAG: hypothetical protein OIF50_17955 [Flavobacteriaceae bacterium]|nr:hypothetical protein [Flavobacteriaceae bacterium]